MFHAESVNPDEITSAQPISPSAGDSRPTTSFERHSTGTDRNIPSRSTSSPPPGPSLALLDEPPKAPPKPKKGILTFFTLKEPSTSAWAEFAQQQRSETAAKGTNPAGFQTKQLPPQVPKVNSKWDGMPSAASSRPTSRPGTRNSLNRNINTPASEAKRSVDGSNRSTSPRDIQTEDPAHPFRNFASSKKPDSNSSPSTVRAPISPGQPSAQIAKSGTVELDSSRPEPTIEPGNVIANSEASESGQPAIEPAIEPQNKQDPNEFSPPPELLLSFTPPQRLSSNTATDLRNSNNSVSGNAATTFQAPPSVSRNALVDGRKDSPTLPSSEISDVRSRAYHRLPRVFKEVVQSSANTNGPPMETVTAENPLGIATEEAAEAPDIPRGLRGSTNLNISSEPSADSSPHSPRTPEEYVSGITANKDSAADHPVLMHLRKRSTEDSPKWPLPSQLAVSGTAAVEAGTKHVPPLPAKSPRRLSNSSIDSDLSAGKSLEDSSPTVPSQATEHGLSPTSSPPTGTINNRVRSFSRPLPRSTNAAAARHVPLGTVSIVRDNRTYVAANTRSAPAFQPGRVVTKDSELATIPESDTSSTHSASDIIDEYGDSTDQAGFEEGDYDRGLRTTMYLDSDTDSELDEAEGEDEELTYHEEHFEEEDHGSQTAPGTNEYGSAAGSAHPRRGTSHGSWLEMSSRERLGLGSSIRKEIATTPPWPTADSPDIESSDSYVLEQEAGGSGGRRSSLRNVFRRGSRNYT